MCISSSNWPKMICQTIQLSSTLLQRPSWGRFNSKGCCNFAMADGSHGTVLVKKSSRSWGEVVSHSNEVNKLTISVNKRKTIRRSTTCLWLRISSAYGANARERAPFQGGSVHGTAAAFLAGWVGSPHAPCR